MSDATTNADQKEAFHRDAEAKIRTFAYDKPSAAKDRDGKPMVKQVANLVRGDLIRLNVQIVKEGGENNLHYHTGGDTAWMVLKGAARLYGIDDKLLGEIGPNGGILLPGGSRYRFEKVGSEDLEILQIVGKATREAQTARINLDRHKDWMNEDRLQVYDKTADNKAAR
jgi:mannose-6-phosphate isomerase-like protein (cupin superfamily)